MCIMYLSLCPKGSEGTTYALLTTLSNLAGTVAFDISTVLTKLWDTSSGSLSAGEFTGVFNLTLLCVLISPLPLVLLPLIPKDRVAQQELQKDKRKSYWCGVVFLTVAALSFILTIVESVFEVVEGEAKGGGSGLE